VGGKDAEKLASFAEAWPLAEDEVLEDDINDEHGALKLTAGGASWTGFRDNTLGATCVRCVRIVAGGGCESFED